MTVVPYVFRHSLKKTGIHIDFLRLRCGKEGTFQRGIRSLRRKGRHGPRVYIAFAEWDAIVVQPCEKLYPRELNDLYGTTDVVTSISGNAGYFSYLWDHPVNSDLHDKLARLESDGAGVLISLRFEDWLRNHLGLGAELLTCDILQNELRTPENDGIEAIVAHSLGWNDVVIFLHAADQGRKNDNRRRLTELLSWIRILTLSHVYGPKHPDLNAEQLAAPMFAASYTHLIGGYDLFQSGRLSLGTLAEEIVAAKLLVRVPASFEPDVRCIINGQLPNPVQDEKLLERMPSEMGHYSFSVDVSDMATRAKGGAREVFGLVRKTRQAIGDLGPGSGYAETSTIFTFREPQHGIEKLVKPKIAEDERREIEEVVRVLKVLPDDLAALGASSMTIHRFSSVLVTLIDHLSDPIRSSVVRHAAGFMRSLPDRIGGLGKESVDDLCHVCEAAVGQAIDGIAQFQHDANSIGLSGRGGYTRLIVAIEMFVRDIFIALDVQDEPPLITFGLRTGSPGSLDRFQLDIPFRVVFTPSDWYILLHEVGHHVWINAFGWMTESVATYEALSREIMLTPPTKPLTEAQNAARAEFLSCRSIVRELFPNLLVHRLTCGDDLAQFDRISMQHVLRATGKSIGMRTMLIAVVLHALLEEIGMRDGRPKKGTKSSAARAEAWWQGWKEMRNVLKQIEKTSPKEARRHLTEMAQRAVNSVGRTLAQVTKPASSRANDRQKILGSQAFLDSVVDVLTSIIDVLAFSNEQFAAKNPPGSQIFHRVQCAIDDAIEEEAAYDAWSDQFGDWLAAGEVFALAPRAHVWTKLLLQADAQLRHRAPSTFLVSQLSVVLSMWHRAVTGRPSGSEAPDRLANVLRPLNLVRRMFVQKTKRTKRGGARRRA